jgi:hypothetical protein
MKKIFIFIIMLASVQAISQSAIKVMAGATHQAFYPDGYAGFLYAIERTYSDEDLGVYYNIGVMKNGVTASVGSAESFERRTLSQYAIALSHGKEIRGDGYAIRFGGYAYMFFGKKEVSINRSYDIPFELGGELSFMQDTKLRGIQIGAGVRQALTSASSRNIIPMQHYFLQAGYLIGR